MLACTLNRKPGWREQLSQLARKERTGILRKIGSVLEIDKVALAKRLEEKNKQKEEKVHAHAPHEQQSRVMRDGSMGERQSRRARRSRTRRRQNEKATSRSIARGYRRVASAMEQQANPSGGGASARITATMQVLQSWSQQGVDRKDLHAAAGHTESAQQGATANRRDRNWVQVHVNVPETNCENGAAGNTENENQRKMEDGILLVVPVNINGHSCRGLIDNGATRCFISIDMVKKYSMTCQAEDTFLELGNGQKILSKGKVVKAHVGTGGIVGGFDFTLTKLLHQVDVVLGLNWLQTVNPIIDWKESKLYLPAAVGTSMLTGTWLQDNEKVQIVKVLAIAEELEALKDKNVQRKIAVIKTPQFWEYRRNEREWVITRR